VIRWQEPHQLVRRPAFRSALVLAAALVVPARSVAQEPAPEHQIAALTIGYVHDFVERRWGRIGIGGDATVYSVPENMLDSYGSPHSYHFFVRYRPSGASSTPHVH
jgi:hypothetical protein